MITIIWGMVIGILFVNVVSSCASYSQSENYASHVYTQWAVFIAMLVLAIVLTGFTHSMFGDDANWAVPATPTPTPTIVSLGR